MSYHLAFWRDLRDARPDPHGIYEALLTGQGVDGIEPLDLEPLLAGIAERFPLDRTPGLDEGYAVWTRNDDADADRIDAVIEFWWSPLHLLADARGNDTPDDLNAVIDLAVDIADTRLYDPQTGERFD